ncbi:hypothetical protein E2C01_022610 [Portunus trituberculatus]|uniref:Uncharacterized protein n=1 Tax=Portunus trituberculatus TaxID=210409 RepID=A0A5B7E5U5_PORTR|nr:hypothetical protein [Portunus trituberculatus]
MFTSVVCWSPSQSSPLRSELRAHRPIFGPPSSHISAASPVTHRLCDTNEYIPRGPCRPVKIPEAPRQTRRNTTGINTTSPPSQGYDTPRMPQLLLPRTTLAQFIPFCPSHF